MSVNAAAAVLPGGLARLGTEMFPLRWNQADETGSFHIAVRMVNLSPFCLIKTQIYCLIKSLLRLFIAAFVFWRPVRALITNPGLDVGSIAALPGHFCATSVFS